MDSRLFNRKRFLLNTFSTLLLLAALLLLLSVVIQNATLAVGSGFEDGSNDHWEVSSSDRCRIVSDAAHTGVKSLRMTCNGESHFASARQTKSVDGRGTLHFSAWVKLSEVQGTGTYFTISWYDDRDNLVDLYYSSTIVGTLDWTELKLISRVPADAKTYTIGLHIHPAPGGTVWYDDVSAEIEDEVTLRALLRSPGYRGELRPNRDKEIVVGAEVDGSADHPIDTLSASVTVLAEDGCVVGQAEKTDLAENNWENIRVNLDSAAPGQYRAVARLTVRQTGEELRRQELTFSVLGQDRPAPSVYIDEHNRCVVNGELFFPVGYYTWGTDRTHIAALDKVVETKFNCLVHYNVISDRTIHHAARYMDAANDHGLKILISTKHCYDNFSTDPIRFGSWEGALPVLRGAVTTFKSHPALLGWYINDERSDFFLPQIGRAYDYITENDPDHIIYQVLRRAQYPALHVASSGALGTDCYPVHLYYSGKSANISMEEVGRATDLVRNATMGARAVWEVVECGQITSNGRPPTFKEMMCESYMALTRGARGLFYFCLPYALRDGDQQMQSLKALGEELEKVRPIALGVDVASTDAVIVSDKRISALTRATNDSLYVMAVNPSDELIHVTFRLGPNVQGRSVERHAPNVPTRLITIRTHEFIDAIEPLGTRVYKLPDSR